MIPGSSLGGRIVGEGAIFTVTDGPDAVRVHARLFGEEMHGSQGTGGGKFPVAGEPIAGFGPIRCSATHPLFF